MAKVVVNETLNELWELLDAEAQFWETKRKNTTLWHVVDFSFVIITLINLVHADDVSNIRLTWREAVKPKDIRKCFVDQPRNGRKPTEQRAKAVKLMKKLDRELGAFVAPYMTRLGAKRVKHSTTTR